MTLQTDVTTPTVKRNPYVGPQAFRRGDRLYGRDRAAADLLDVLVAERIVLLHSPSGAGKTSLIQARMLGLLEDENFDVLPVVRLNHEVPDEVAQKGGSLNRYVLSALLSLEEALPTGAQQPVTALADLTLADYLAQRPKGDGHLANGVLVVDQFEEVITADPVDQDAKDGFFLQLGALLRDRSLWCLLSMREDFLAELDPYARHVPTRFMNRYRLDLLTGDEALDAMIYPARDAGVDFDPVAAGKLVDDLRTVRVQRGSTVVEELGPYVEPVQLQVVCRGVWDRLEGGATRIELSDVEAVGDVDQALASYYAQCVASAAEATGVAERAVRDWCEDELITAQGFRGQAMHGPATADDAGDRALALLTSVHLLRAESRRGAVWYELAHDRLIDPIKEDNDVWKREHLSDLERRASLWEEQSRSEGLLLTGPELDAAEDWAASRPQPLAGVELAFLAASRRAREAAQREARANARIRRWLAIAIVGLVLALVASGLAVSSSIQAGEATLSARKATLRAAEAAIVGQSLANLSDDPQLGLRLAIKGAGLQNSDAGGPSENVLSALQLASDANPVVQVLREVGSRAIDASYSRDGHHIASMDEKGILHVLDAETGAVAWSRHIGDANFAISPDGSRVAVIGNPGVYLWDVRDDGEPAYFMKSVQVDFLSFSPDGEWVVCVAVEAGSLMALDVTNGRQIRLQGNPGVDPPQWTGQGPWSRRGAKLVITGGDAGPLIYDAPTALPSALPLRATGAQVIVSPRGGFLATRSEEGLSVYDKLGAQHLFTMKSEIGAVSFSGDGARLLIVGANASLYDTRTGALLRRYKNPSGEFGGGPQLSPARSDHLLVVDQEGQLAIWDMSAGLAQTERAISFAVSSGGIGMTVSNQGSIRLWSPMGTEIGAVSLLERLRAAGFERAVPVGAAESMYAAEFPSADLSPTGTFVAVVSPTGAAYTVPLDSKRKPVRLAVKEPGDLIAKVVVSRTGEYVAGVHFPSSGAAPVPSSETQDGTEGMLADPVVGLSVWDATTGHLVHRLQPATPVIDPFELHHLALSPNGDEIAAITGGSVLVWHLPSGKVRLEISPPPPAAPGTPPAPSTTDVPTVSELEELPTFTAVAWSPDGRLLATAERGILQLRDPKTGKQVGRDFSPRGDSTFDIAFDPAGDRVVTTHDDKTVVVWSVQSRNVILGVDHKEAYGLDDVRTVGFVGRNRLLLRTQTGIPRVVWLNRQELLDTARARATRELNKTECMRYVGDEQICSTD